MCKGKHLNIEGAFWGQIVGDALGVPVEFKTRSILKSSPVEDMRGYGTHNQPPGTWSDDTSLVLASIDSLSKGYDPLDMLEKFCDWYYKGIYTPYGKVFDIGNATRNAITYYKENGEPLAVYDEFSNGNGSLMRVLPVSIVFRNSPVEDITRISSEVSALTHGHVRSCLCCSYFSLFIKHIMEGLTIKQSYIRANSEIKRFIPESETSQFARILDGNIVNIPEKEIYSDGYVVHTLEAALWCFMKGNNFSDSLLKAVNLGDDTDTVGAVTGSMAGAFYGIDEIPSKWIEALVGLNKLKKACSMLVETDSAKMF